MKKCDYCKSWYREEEVQHEFKGTFRCLKCGGFSENAEISSIGKAYRLGEKKCLRK